MSEEHYEAVCERYDEGAFYDSSSSYNRWLLPLVSAALGLGSSSRLADLGGGTGGFTAALAQAAGLETSPCVVEPGPLRQQAEARGLATLEQDAAAFAATAKGSTWDALLLKEVVHHLPLGDFADYCVGFARRVASGGRLVIVTRPVVPDYPLFGAAKIVWRLNQPPARKYADALTSAGFEVEEQTHAFAFEIAREDWFDLIRRRFWSTFSHFSDDQLEVGIEELKAAHPEDLLRFEERLTFVIGKQA